MTVLRNAYQATTPMRLFAMAAAILIFTATQPCFAQSQMAQELLAMPEPGLRLTTDGQASSGLDLGSRANASTIGSDEPAENSYDFTNPDRIPGFASQPYAVPSNSEILD